MTLQCSWCVFSGGQVRELWTWRKCESRLSFVFASGQLALATTFAMASTGVIEPPAQSSTAQPLSRRRFSHDIHGISPDEIDGLMSSSGTINCSFFFFTNTFNCWNALTATSENLFERSNLPTCRRSPFPCGASSFWSARWGYTFLNAWYTYYMQSGQHREIHYSLKGTWPFSRVRKNN